MAGTLSALWATFFIFMYLTRCCVLQRERRDTLLRAMERRPAQNKHAPLLVARFVVVSPPLQSMCKRRRLIFATAANHYSRPKPRVCNRGSLAYQSGGGKPARIAVDGCFCGIVPPPPKECKQGRLIIATLVTLHERPKPRVCNRGSVRHVSQSVRRGTSTAHAVASTAWTPSNPNCLQA